MQNITRISMEMEPYYAKHCKRDQSRSGAGRQYIPVPITPNDTQIQNIPDPTRVGRADARSDRQDTANMDVGRRYDSYFQTFLQALRSSGSITETAARFLIAHSGTLVLSGLSQGIAQELSQFMQMLSVGPEELLALLQNQMSSGARFSGKLFDALRDVLQHNPLPA